MDILFRIVELGANFFDAAGAWVFFMLLLGKNERIKSRLGFGIISVIFVMVLAYFQNVSENTMIQLSNMIFIDLVFEMLFLRGKIGTKIVYNMI